MTTLAHRVDVEWPALVSYGAVAGAFTLVGGPLGALAAAGTIGLAYATGVPYAVAAGHVALLGFAPAGLDVRAFLLVEAALLALAATPPARVDAPGRFVLVLTGSAVCLGATTWALARIGGFAAAGAGSLALLAVAFAVLRWHDRARDVAAERHRSSHRSNQ